MVKKLLICQYIPVFHKPGVKEHVNMARIFKYRAVLTWSCKPVFTLQVIPFFSLKNGLSLVKSDQNEKFQTQFYRMTLYNYRNIFFLNVSNLRFFLSKNRLLV